MFIYRKYFHYDNPFNVVFLCGNRYQSSNERDKRNVLKAHLEKSIDNCKVVILEENFDFRNTNRRHLAYDDIFLYSLGQLEELAALFANSIIIIHETLSTAAELGMFANNPALVPKICLLSPNKFSVEEDKITAFIRLAFLQDRAPEIKLGNHIEFFPDTEIYYDSEFKSSYNTYFHNDEIGPHLSTQLANFIKRNNDAIEFKFSKSKFNKSINDYDINFHINGKNSLEIYIHPYTLRAQLISLFSLEDFNKQISVTKSISDHVTDIQKYYLAVLCDSIEFHEGVLIKEKSVIVHIKGSKCTLRQSIGYFLYLLQALKVISLEQPALAKSPRQRHIKVHNDMLKLCSQFNSLIYEKPTTAFGRTVL